MAGRERISLLVQGSHFFSFASQTFPSTKGVAVDLENIIRGHLWSGVGECKRDHLVNWDLVRKPKEEGGLGLGNLISKNFSLLGKWLWRFPLEPESLWHKVIFSIRGFEHNRWYALAHAFCSHSWKAISQVSSLFLSLTSLKAGRGDKISFWEDRWVGEHAFSIIFPRLYHLSSSHYTLISSFLLWDGDSFSWNLHLRRNPLDRKLRSCPLFLLSCHFLSL